MPEGKFTFANGPLTVRLVDEDDPNGYVEFIDQDGNQIMTILRRPYEALMQDLVDRAIYESKS